MMGCYDTVTVWNEHNNAFYRHVIPVKCKWKSKLVRTVSGTTANVADVIVVVIPFTDLYKPFSEWKLLSEDDKKQYFTFNKGDIMALGAITVDITGMKPYTKSEIRQMFSPNSLAIKVIQDNTTNANGKHFRIEGG